MKKSFQIIWIILAFVFLGLFFLKIWSDNIVVYQAPNYYKTSYKHFKINKLTGKVQIRLSTEKIESDWITPYSNLKGFNKNAQYRDGVLIFKRNKIFKYHANKDTFELVGEFFSYK